MEAGNHLLTSETAEGHREYPADNWYSVTLKRKAVGLHYQGTLFTPDVHGCQGL